MTIRIGMTLGALALTLAAGSYAVPTAAAATTSAAGRCRLPVYGPGAAYQRLSRAPWKLRWRSPA